MTTQISILEQIKLALDTIAATQGTNAKLAQANAVKDVPMLREVVHMALTPRVSYFMRKLPDALTSITESKYTTDPLRLLDDLSTRTLSGNRALSETAHVFGHLLRDHEDALTLLTNILRRNLKTGIGKTGWNKVYGTDFFPKVPCMKAREQSAKNLANIAYPAYAQTKADGTRLIVTTDCTRSLVFQSRNGSVFHFIDGLKDQVVQMFDTFLNGRPRGNIMMDGEIVFQNIRTGKLLDRKTSNGLATRCIQGVNSYDTTLYKPIYIVWDFVFNGAITTFYGERLEALDDIVRIHTSNTNDQSIRIIGTHTVNSFDEAKAIYMKKLEEGEEGIILKNIDAPWSDNRSKHLVKFKEEIEVDLRAATIVKGEVGSKLEHTLGAIVFTSDDGSISVSVGSGYTDKDRDYIINNQSEFLGLVGTIKCNALITDKNRTQYSLFLPTLVEWRHDKNYTNTAQEFIDAD